MTKYKDKDYYFKKAKREGYSARSVYKLKEIDVKYHLVKRGAKVLDLGSYPGSWLKYLAKRVGKTGRVLGVDITQITHELPENVDFIHADVYKLDVEALRAEYGAFDCVTSDMAPKTTGIRVTDQAASYALVERAAEIARALLKPGGNFVSKMFQGPDTSEMVSRLKNGFEFVKLQRPKASTRSQLEIFLVAIGKK